MSVYFIRYQHLVKIGFSDDLPKRLYAIRAAIPVPVELIGHMPGDKEVEAHFHRVFHGCRRTGEWFELTQDQITAIAGLLDTSEPLPPKVRTGNSVYSAARAEWDATSARLREVALSAWPTDTHKTRKDKLAAILGWGRQTNSADLRRRGAWSCDIR